MNGPLSTFQNHNSQPSYALWRQSILIQIAAADNSPACREARGTGPSDAARTHLATVDGMVGGAACSNSRGPDSFSPGCLGGTASPFHAQGYAQ